MIEFRLLAQDLAEEVGFGLFLRALAFRHAPLPPRAAN
jgi:hypothetical protein